MKNQSIFNNHLMEALLLGVLNYKNPLDYSRGHLKSMPDNEDAMCLAMHYSDFHRKSLLVVYKKHRFYYDERLKDFIEKTIERLHINPVEMEYWEDIAEMLRTGQCHGESHDCYLPEIIVNHFIILFLDYTKRNFIPARNHIIDTDSIIKCAECCNHKNEKGYLRFDLFEKESNWVAVMIEKPLLEEVEYDNEAEAPFITTIFPEES